MKPIIQLLSNNIAQRKQKMLQTALAEPLVEKAIIERRGIKAVIRMGIEEGRINEGSISRDSVQLCWIAEESAKLDRRLEERRAVKLNGGDPSFGAKNFINTIKAGMGELEPLFEEYCGHKLRRIYACGYSDGEEHDPYIMEAITGHMRAEYELLKEAKFQKHVIIRSAQGLGVFGVNERYAEAGQIFGADGENKELAKIAAGLVVDGKYKSILDVKEAYEKIRNDALKVFASNISNPKIGPRFRTEFFSKPYGTAKWKELRPILLQKVHGLSPEECEAVERLNQKKARMKKVRMITGELNKKMRLKAKRAELSSAKKNLQNHPALSIKHARGVTTKLIREMRGKHIQLNRWQEVEDLWDRLEIEYGELMSMNKLLDRAYTIDPNIARQLHDLDRTLPGFSEGVTEHHKSVLAWMEKQIGDDNKKRRRKFGKDSA